MLCPDGSEHYRISPRHRNAPDIAPLAEDLVAVEVDGAVFPEDGRAGSAAGGVLVVDSLLHGVFLGVVGVSKRLALPAPNRFTSTGPSTGLDELPTASARVSEPP